MQAKTTLKGKYYVTQKVSQTFFGNTSVQQNIVKSTSDSFLDFLIFSDLQKLPMFHPAIL